MSYRDEDRTIGAKVAGLEQQVRALQTARAVDLGTALAVAALDDAVSVSTQAAARVTHSANQPVPVGTGRILDFDTVVQDDSVMHDAGFPARLTAVRSGWWHLTASVAFAINATGWREVGFRVGGSLFVASALLPAANGEHTRLSLATDVWLDEGDYVEVEANQNSPGPLDVVALSQWTPVFTMSFV